MAFRRLFHAVLLAAFAATSLVAVSNSTATATAGPGGSFVPLSPALLADTRSGVGLAEGPVGPDSVRTIQVAGRGGVPTSNVSAVVLDLGAESTANTVLSVYPANAERKYGNLSVSATEERAANTAIVRLDDGKIKVHNSAGSTHFNVGVQGYFTETSTDGSSGGFVPIEPQRVVRTDRGVGINASPLQGGTVYTVQIGGVGAIPADATSVYANVRVRDAAGPSASSTARGGLRVGPSNTTVSQSTTSVLDYAKGPDADSGLALKLGPDGKIKLTITTNTTADLLIDVQGYFTAGAEGGAFTPIDNRRLYDSRNSPNGPLKAGEVREVRLAGSSGIQEDAGAVALHISAIDYTGTGALAVYNPDTPNGSNGTSNVGFKTDYDSKSRSSTAIVGLSGGGTVLVKNLASSGSTHVLLNAQGWFTPPTETAAGAVESEPDRIRTEMGAAIAEANASSEGDEPLPAIVSYDLHELAFQSGAATRSTTLPLPTGCSVKDAATRQLSCDFGTVVVSPSATTEDGTPVDVQTTVSAAGVQVSPQVEAFNGYVTAYVTRVGEQSAAQEAEAVFTDLVEADDEALLEQSDITTQENDLNADNPTPAEPVENSGDNGDSTRTEVAQSGSGTGTGTGSESTAYAARGSIRRPAYVGVPNTYRYCPETCKPKGRHDYCTKSQNAPVFAVGRYGPWRVVRFYGPCARHDMAIERIATWNATVATKRNGRSTQDGIFRRNLRQNCANALYDQKGTRMACYNKAGTYYAVVSYTTSKWNGR